jgi:predicted dehydrogenase
MAEPKIVLVGAGFIAKVAHLPAFRAAGAPVGALCARSQERARMLAEQYEVPRVYGDWRQMLAEEKPDIVSVCLPNALHCEVTLAALKGGAHVLCEKPLATSVAEAQAMFDTARRSGRLLMTAHHFRFDSAAQAVKTVVDSGTLGEIYYSEATALRRMGIPGWGAFHQRAFSAGGCLIDYGVHALDQTLWLVGNPKPVSVSAMTQRRFGQRPEIAVTWGGNAWDPQRFDVEDFAVAFVRFQDGSSLVLRASWAAHIARDRFGSLLLGTEGGVTTDPPTVHRLAEGKQVNEELGPFPWRNPYEAEIAHFLAVVRGEVEPIIKEEETMNVQCILDAAYRSAEEGREVPIAG